MSRMTCRSLVLFTATSSPFAWVKVLSARPNPVYRGWKNRLNVSSYGVAFGSIGSTSLKPPSGL